MSQNTIILPKNLSKSYNMLSLIGNSEAKMDAKGRVFVPASFRHLLDDQHVFVLRKSLFNQCLVLYPEETWNELIQVLRSRWKREEEQIFRQFVAEAERIELEDNGRMLIPKRYLTAFNFEKDVRFVGCDSTIEIWPAGKIEETFVETETLATEIERLMSEQTP